MTVPEGLAARVAGADVIGRPATWAPVLDPCHESPRARVGSAAAGDVERAVGVAREAWAGWRSTSPTERAAALLGLAEDLRDDRDELSRLITGETGKLLREARAEIDLSCRYLEWFAAIVPSLDPEPVGGRARVLRQPVGVVAAISTWNFPLSIPVRKVAPALAAGCAVVLKPSPLSPGTALELVRHCERHLPAGVVGMVLGEAEQGRALAEHPSIRAVSFTGSTHNGVELAARLVPTLTRSLLELGGRAPVVVLPDADLDEAVETVMQAKFRNNGASCIAANNVFVHERLAGPLLSALEERVRALEPGDPLAEGTTLGPMRTPSLARNIEELAADAERRGCRVVRGRAAGIESSCFTSPVLVHADRDVSSWDTEVYGPLLQVRAFTEVTDVVEEVNGWRRGLGGYLVSGDVESAADLAQTLRIGMVGIGTGSPNSPELPFGGFDQAGWGREGSRAGLDPFLEHQSIALGR